MADGHTIRDHVFDRTLAQLRTLALPRCGAPMRVTQRFTAAQLYLAAFDSS